MARTARSSVQRPVGALLVYRRVSTESQADETRSSPREQLRAAEMYAKAKLGAAIEPALVFDDLGVSGATAEGRPGFMELVRYCEAHPRSRNALGVILCLNDSRFGRFENPEEATYWRVLLQKLGWVVRFCEGDEIEDGVARGVMRFIGSAQASEYRANLKRTARRAARATAEEGRWQNRAPMGFRRQATRSDGSVRLLEGSQRKSDDEVVRLALGPADEVEIVRYCFTMYASGARTIGALARDLHVRWPSRRWSQNTVNALLKNPAYAGDVIWCRRPHDATERRETWMRSPEHWVVVRDAHPAIISRDLFERVQRRLAGNRKATRATAGGYPLSGLIKCKTCGDRFIGGGGRIGPLDDPDRFRKYQESSSARPLQYKERCPGPIATISKRWVEAAVVKEVASVASDPTIQRAIADELDRMLSTAMSDSSTRQGALKSEREKLQRQQKRVVDAIATGTTTEKEAQATLSEIRSRIDAIEADLDRSKFSGRRLKGASELRDRVLATALDFPKLAASANGAQLRELLSHWLAGAEYDKRTGKLTLTIRTVPDIAGIAGDGMDSRIRRARDTRNQTPPFVVRVLQIPRRKAS